MDELKKLYKKEKYPKTKERLLAIKLYYDGKREKEIKEILGVPSRTLRRWKKQWNENGLEGLRYKQGKGGGRKPKLSMGVWKAIAKVAIAKAMDPKEVAIYVKDKYSASHIPIPQNCIGALADTLLDISSMHSLLYATLMKQGRTPAVKHRWILLSWSVASSPSSKK